MARKTNRSVGTILKAPRYQMREATDTYQVVYDTAHGQRAIVCLRCRATSYNANDVFHKYCGRCHRFLSDNP